MKKRFTEEQIIKILQEVKQGITVEEVCRNGTEFTSKAIIESFESTGISWEYIEPGKPCQNG